MIWHSNPLDAVLNELQVDPTIGLSSADAKARQKVYGENRLQEKKSLSVFQRFVRQMKKPSVLLLLFTAFVTFIYCIYTLIIQQQPTGWLEPLVLVAVALLNLLLGSILGARADSAMNAIGNQPIHTARVRRDGTTVSLSTHQLVPGDIVLLEAGNLVPADCRLIDAAELRCNESRLTDEELPTFKVAEGIFDDITPLAQRTNMLYSGTAITAGTATAVVVATGMRSEMGHTHDASAAQPLSVQKWGRKIQLWWSLAVTGFSLLALVIGLIFHDSFLAVALTVTAFMVAAHPQSLTARLMQLMAHHAQQGICQHLQIHRPEAISTLGRVNLLCVQQELLHSSEGATLCSAFAGHRSVPLTGEIPKAPGLSQLIRLAALNANHGNPVDEAILQFLPEMGIDQEDLLLDMPRIGELPPTDARKTTVHLAGEQTLVLVSGDWQQLLPLCAKANVEELTAAATAMEKDGLQVVAVTFRLTETAPAVYVAEELEQNLVCAGLLGIRLPLHEQAPKAKGKLRTILFSDESAAIASATARGADITAEPIVATAAQIEALTDEELLEGVRQYNVYCCLSPQQKHRVLTALKRLGYVVALTANHSEEAQLLSLADLGIARSAVASDVAKEAADLILTTDSYAGIVTAINEGRRLRLEEMLLLGYLLIVSYLMFILALIALFGWVSLSYWSVILLGLHLLLFALPTPLWVTLGVSRLIKKVTEKS